MLLSERELGLSDEHEGIVDLPADAPVGTPYAAWAGLDDPVIDVGVTPNRPDALGIYGIARDLAAKGIGRLKPIDAPIVEGAFESPIGVELRFDDPDEQPCPLFVGRYFRGVQERPRRRTGCSGGSAPSGSGRSRRWSTSPTTSPCASARPLHVFDADKVKGTIHARLARDGETIEALDGKTYALDSVDDGDRRRHAARSASPASSAARRPAARRRRRTSSSRRPISIRSAPPRPAASSASIPMRATASSAASIRPSSRPARRSRTRMILELCGGEASELVDRRARRRSGASPFRCGSTG